jgi:hypothetical protein
MPDPISHEQAEGNFSQQFHDPAFEPRSSFDFEDDLNLLDNNMAHFNTFHPDNMDFTMMEGML